MPSQSHDETMNAEDRLREALAPVYAARPDRPYVVAQLGQSLDGRVATVTGASQWISGPGALDHVHRLRSAVDAVVVGCGTVLADNPQLTVRRVDGRDPARVVIDPNGRISPNSLVFADDGARRIVVSAEPRPAPAGVETAIIAMRNGALSPIDIACALFELGLRKILIEGGATTISRFIDAGAVDRLHIFMSPIILGSGVTGLSLAPIASLDRALRPSTRIHILDDGEALFDCDLRQQSEG